MLAQSQQFTQDRLPQRVARRSTGTTSISLTLKLIAFALFLPDELSFYMFQFRFTLIRLVLFSLTPVLLTRFGRSLVARKRRLLFPDIMVVLTTLWMIISPALVVDLGYSLNHSAPFAVEFCGSYFAGRILLSEHGQALRFVNLICHVIAIVGLLGVLDILAGAPVIHDILRSLTGYVTISDEWRTEGGFRAGFFRATGPIDHPILFGIICAIGLLLAVASPIRAKLFAIAACGLGVLSSLSGAPIQATTLGLGLLTYDRILAHFRYRWWLLIGICAVAVAASYTLSSQPVAFVLTHLLFETDSFWIRLYQWSTIGAIILTSPWIGIGFELYRVAPTMPFFVFGSVDSLWLFLALVYGIPGAILVLLSMVGAIRYPSSGPRVNLTVEESKLANTLGILIALIVLLGFTVDLWEASWMLTGLLVGIKAHLADLGSQRLSTLANVAPEQVPHILRGA
jgi:hypothetical protein